VAIEEAGFTTVINVAPHHDARYSLPDETGTFRARAMVYVHIQVQAAPTTPIFWHSLPRGMHTVGTGCGSAAPPTYVSVFVGLYRVIRHGWAVEPAFELMRGLWPAQRNMVVIHRRCS
jgi:hypothetical protein